MERIGVYITEGPQDFEIIQRDADNCATISVAGRWVAPELPYEPVKEVYIRLLHENSGQPIIPYTRCKIEGDRWSVTLPQIPAGGLYKIETGLSLDQAVRPDWNYAGEMRHFIGVGDVYVVAGQSNSSGYGKGIAEDEPEIGIHALRYDGNWMVASHPLTDCTGAGALSDTEPSNSGTSPYLNFARCLKRELHIPIGLVPTALGGSPLCRWNPDEEGSLYRRMQYLTARLTNGYCGVLWYQGCSETAATKESETYEVRFTNMVSHWRKDSCKPELNFITCQLNRFCNKNSTADLSKEVYSRHWGLVREAQRQVARNIPHCYVVPTTDIPLSDSIHNSAQGNLMLGERIARLTLSEVYGCKPSFTTPSLKRAFQRTPDTIGLEFDGLLGELEPLTDDPQKLDFTVTDQKGQIGMTGCHFRKDEVYITLEREPVGACTISCGDQKDFRGLVPLDTTTYMPILSFFEVAVEPLA